MDIDYLIDNFDESAGHKEEIALIIYYLENSEEKDKGVTQAEVKDVIRNSRSPVSTSAVSTYFSRLSDSEWISEATGDTYILTHDGEDTVEKLIDDDALDEHRDEDELFIDTDAIDDERYEELIEDINDSYRYRVHSGTMVLTRKLFEDMVFEILKTHYAGKDVQMFYNQEDDCHYSFNELLNKFKDGVSTLRRYSRELDDAFVEEVRDIKNTGNRDAHSIRADLTDDEVEEWSDEATRIAEVLYDILLGARIARESNN